MSEVKINFEHKGSKISLQGKREDRMKEIIEKLKLKIDIEIDKIYLLYNGQKINVEMKIEDIINNEDKNKKLNQEMMKIIKLKMKIFYLILN